MPLLADRTTQVQRDDNVCPSPTQSDCGNGNALSAPQAYPDWPPGCIMTWSTSNIDSGRGPSYYFNQIDPSVTYAPCQTIDYSGVTLECVCAPLPPSPPPFTPTAVPGWTCVYEPCASASAQTCRGECAAGTAECRVRTSVVSQLTSEAGVSTCADVPGGAHASASLSECQAYAENNDLRFVRFTDRYTNRGCVVERHPYSRLAPWVFYNDDVTLPNSYPTVENVERAFVCIQSTSLERCSVGSLAPSPP